MYQSLIESSDLRVTIFCPGLSRNADFMSFGTAKLCVITGVLGTVLLQQHHLPRLDEIACLESV